MDAKKLVWLGMIIGSIGGSYVPMFWGTSVFSMTSILFGVLGGFVGIWISFKLYQWIEY